MTFHLHTSVCWVQVCTICDACTTYTCYTRYSLVPLMLPCCSIDLLAGLDADDMSVECKLCIAVHLYASVSTCCCDLPLRPGRLGVGPNAVRAFCASQVAGGFPNFTHRPRPQATTNSQHSEASAHRSRACLPCA